MLTRVKQWLVEHAGLDPQLLQRDWLERVIQQRIEQLELPGEERYCLLLARDPVERERIIREVSVGETCFFRYPASYELLVQHVKQTLREPCKDTAGKDTAGRDTAGRDTAGRDTAGRDTAGRDTAGKNAAGKGRAARLRMLSVACATGEEPYSMAIAAVHAGWPIKAIAVDALDRNAGSLATARLGRYPLRSRHAPLPAWALPWLRVDSRELHVDPAIRSAVTFHCADAVTVPDSTLAAGYEIIFCRNLLIYLNEGARNRLVDRLTRWLAPHGLLFTGHAEQLESLRRDLQPLSYPGAFCWRKGEPAARLEISARHSTRSHSSPIAIAEEGRVTGGWHRSQSAAGPVVAGPVVAGPVAEVAEGLSTAGAGQRHVDNRPGVGSPDAAPPGRRETGPSLPPVRLIERARHAAGQGQLDAALADVQAALRSTSPAAELYALLGSIQLSRGQLSEARDALRRAVYLDPRHEESLLQLAIVYQRMGDDAHAKRYRNRAAEVHRQTAGGSEA